MARVIIESPPDGNDVSTRMVQEFTAVLPPGMNVKEALIGLAKFYTRQRKLQLRRQQEQAAMTGAIQAFDAELQGDPDLGGINF